MFVISGTIYDLNVIPVLVYFSPFPEVLTESKDPEGPLKII